jgi:murein L,D-transpeptidase YcbB/YkuD
MTLPLLHSDPRAAAGDWAARLIGGLLLVLVAGCSSPAQLVAPPPDCPVAEAPAGAADCPPVAAAVHDPEALRQSLDLLSAHGLDPENYAGTDAASAWRLAATHLRFGAVDPVTMTPRLQADASLAALPGRLPPESAAGDYRAALEALAPALPLYAALKDELARQLAARAGMTDAAALADADAQIASLRAGLERLRWLPRETAGRQVLANIPTFEVIALTDGAETSRRAAIFGQLNRQTPEFSDAIEYAVFNPWWDVPDSIARKDKLAQFRRDPGAISRMGYRIYDRAGNAVDASAVDWNKVSASGFPYRIRQAPGPSNALGQVKFIFPNPYAVYLHDTPERALFERTARTFSSGCIRVQDPVGLAGWVLEETPGWGQAEIDAAIATGAETRATLAAPVPIHIVYLTAFPDAGGMVTYAPDVYGRDGAVLEALAAPLPSPAHGSAPQSTLAGLAPDRCHEDG